jgi:hypothetical protein
MDSASGPAAKLANAITAIASAASKVPKWLTGAVAAAVSAGQGFNGAGANAGDGYVAGLMSKMSAATAAGMALGAASEAGLRQKLDSHSPSRALKLVGRDAAEGYTGGLEEGSRGVQSAVERMAGGTVAAAAKGGSTTSNNRGGDSFTVTVNANGGDADSIVQAFDRWFVNRLTGEATALGLTDAGA